jgi:hypothetical protein
VRRSLLSWQRWSISSTERDAESGMTTQTPTATGISEIIPGQLYQSGIVATAEVQAGRFSVVVDLTLPGENPYPRPVHDPTVLHHTRAARYLQVRWVDLPVSCPT